MLIRTDTLVPWTGEPLNGIKHPKNIEVMWIVEELAAVGLVKAIPFVVPGGWRSTGATTWDANGVATRPIEIIPPPTPEEIEALRLHRLDAVFGSEAVIKLLYYLGAEQGMFNGLDDMRAWVEAKAPPPATGGGPPA